MTDQMYQKWFGKFDVGDVLLDNAPRLGRPVMVDSNQIKTLIENNQLWILKISKSIKLLVKMRSVSFLLWKKLNGHFGQLNSFCLDII